MIRYTLIIVIVFSTFMSCSNSESEARKVEQTINDLFSASSALDFEKMGDLITEDFRLSEGGVVLNKQEAIDMMKPGTDRKVQMKHDISVIDLHVDGNFAWILYWNDALVVAGNDITKIKWLESAVLSKVNNQWKLKFAQSTRIKMDEHESKKTVE